MVDLAQRVLLFLLLLSLFTPFVHFSPPLPFAHASFKSLPHDFVPRKTSGGTLQPLPLGAPTGLASYGSKANLTTDAVKGSLTFDSLNLGVDIIPPPYSSNYTYLGTGYASLQLNAVLWIPGHGVYWTQNVIFIASNATMKPQVELINNIWNFSSLSAVMKSQYVHGNGTVASHGFYYYLDPVVYNLTFPFTINLSMTLSNTSSGAVRVDFLYSIKSGNGSVYSGVYDSVVLFPKLSAIRSYYQIGSYAPIELPSDLEYVLGGPGGGSFAVVLGISGSISLYYEKGGVFLPVRDAYTYGSDTAETVYFVTVTRDFENPEVPQGVLSLGNLNSYKLWPISPILEVTLITGISKLVVSGYLIYQSGTGSALAPLSSQTLTLKLVNAQSAPVTTLVNLSVLTSSSGSFTATLPVESALADQLVVSYAGSTAFDPTLSVTQLSVHSLSVRGVSSYTVGVNGVLVTLEAGSTNYVVTPQGSELTLTIANETQVTKGEREVASVFVNGVPFHGESLTLSATTPTNVTIADTVQYLVNIEQRTPTGVTNQSAWYNAGSSLPLTSQRYILVNSTTRYAFQGWVVNGELVNSTSVVLNVSSPLTVNSLYVEQDLITLSSPLSNVSAWAALGEEYSLSAPISYGNFLVVYHFKQWSGTFGGSANPLTFVVSKPVSEVAVYSASYTGVIALFVAVFLLGLGIGLLRRRAQALPRSNTS